MTSIPECETILENILAVLAERHTERHTSTDCFEADALLDRNLHGHRAGAVDYKGSFYNKIDLNSLSA